MAIDFGTKRIGLAVSDPLGITAQGLPTLQRTRMAEDLAHLERLVQEYSARRVVIGNPLSNEGNKTVMSSRVAVFADKLRRRLPCPVELRDERLTSVEAERVLRESHIGIEKRRAARDRVAATILLQGYLDYRAAERARQESLTDGSDGSPRPEPRITGGADE